MRPRTRTSTSPPEPKALGCPVSGRCGARGCPGSGARVSARNAPCDASIPTGGRVAPHSYPDRPGIGAAHPAAPDWCTLENSRADGPAPTPTAHPPRR